MLISVSVVEFYVRETPPLSSVANTCSVVVELHCTMFSNCCCRTPPNSWKRRYQEEAKEAEEALRKMGADTSEGEGV